MKIDNLILKFWKINSHVCYTISEVKKTKIKIDITLNTLGKIIFTIDIKWYTKIYSLILRIV